MIFNTFQPQPPFQHALHQAALKGEEEAVNNLLNQGASPVQLNALAQPPIHGALILPIRSTNELRTAKENIYHTLAAYAPETINARDSSGDTVCHLMVNYGFTELLKELLKKNSHLALEKNNHGLHPLLVAIAIKNAEAANLLLQVEGALTLPDSKGRIALHYAVLSEVPDLIKACFSQEAFKVKDTVGDTPLDLAQKSGFKEIESLLLELSGDKKEPSISTLGPKA